MERILQIVPAPQHMRCKWEADGISHHEPVIAIAIVELDQKRQEVRLMAMPNGKQNLVYVPGPITSDLR